MMNDAGADTIQEEEQRRDTEEDASHKSLLGSPI